MFENQPHRHPLQTFPFWFLITLCAGGVAAWRFGMFSPAERGSAPIEFVAMEQLPPPPEGFEDEPDEPSAWTIAPPPQAPFQVETERPETSESATAPHSGGPSPEPGRTAEVTIQPVGGEANDRARAVTAAGASAEGGERRGQSAVSVPGSREIDPARADQLIDAGEDVAAHRLLSTWYWEFPEERARFQDRIDLLARRIYFSPRPHYMEPHTVQFGDRLESIAKSYRLSWEYLAKLNRVDPQRIRADQKLKVLQGPFSVVVDLGRFELTVHAHGYYVTRFPVGIGKEGSTPVGTFKVTDKVVDPTYYGPDEVIAHDDPTNPLGERWIAINDDAGSLQGYGIHGTIEPDSIGKAASRGCVRLNDRDIAALYDLLTVGSEVIIRR